MKKIGDKRDEQRRYKYVKKLQDQKDWRENLPPPNDIWPTCLIVAPATVVHNWEREFQTWGYFEVGMYTGSERDEVLHDFKLGRLDVLLTSFEIARSDIERLDTLPFSCIFVDEAHRIKNPRSQTTQAFNQFECVIRFGLTGTAIQNDYAELWTLLDWSNPERLGTMDQWRKCVTRPLTTGQSQKATTEQLAVARRLALRLVKNLLPHFFLRRTKALIADQLPGKSHEVVFCRLTNAQLEAYKRFLSLQSVQNMILAQDLCECGSRKKRSSCHHPVEQGEALKYISVFMKISNHLVLILPSPSDNQGQATRNRELANIAFPDGAPSYGLAIFDPNLCGKWAVLNTLLQTWRREQGNKVLVFTRSVKLIEMLKYHLSREGYNYRTFDGSTKQSDRMPIIDEFSNDPDVFLFVISTLAGGTGLNLTAANKVVIFDPNWNPAHDLQAIDRAFRIGQRRDVSVYRLLAAGSLEEHIYRRQIYKQQQMAIGYEASAQTRYACILVSNLSQEGDLFGLKNLFTLNEDSYATKMTIEKANRDQLNWALAHFDGSVLSGIPSEELAANTGKVDAVAADDIKGLKSFLFAEEDQEDTKPSDAIATILASHGAGYMHINDDVLKPTNVEDQLTEVAIKRKRRRRSENIRKKSAQSQEGSQNSQSPPKPAWPPKRKHHKTQAPLSPRSRLYVRQHALIALGYIQEKEDLDKFAADL
ncbi:hypothetical protein SISSUDRAFT_988082 [Sistotremastrum suecicum HHB10207 ss-3]|uniref:P-loop containing nucleoside triphosphate hydrolase protein n=1 Tax=Sistotremastrum suecicum HHB10207 ss-3 TaxID=1314776 RepID=A0A166C830_9AGAM|nr:hypothetical protein SISSUDRAFT_988082 [Sistotremastrum suecicum HHB10207 ss-3]